MSLRVPLSWVIEKYAKNMDSLKEKTKEGPWKNEPDRMEFRYKDFNCLILRSQFLNLCGYVGIKKDHPYYEKNFYELDEKVNVHGGLTYSDFCNRRICSDHYFSNDPLWWLGFDCSHLGDYVPGIHGIHMYIEPSEESYKDIFYVDREIKSLVDQLILLKKE